MKKLISALLIAVSLLSLCACTEKAAEPSTAPVTAAPVTETTAPASEPATAPAEEKTSAFDSAKTLEGESVDELLAAIGEPLSREDYTPSCLGDGEDGLWHYEGFDVYTYRENGKESVYAVLEG